VNLHASTGAARFIGFEKGGPPRFAARGGRSPRKAAAAFLAAHKSAFGLTDPATELSLRRLSRDQYRHHHVRYRQRHRGLAVFGGQLDFHFDAKGDLTSVSGVVIPEITVSATPGVPRPRAEAVAVNLTHKSSTGEPGRDSLSALGAELMFFRAGLVQGVAGETHLVYAVDVADADRTIWEIVFVDAHSGAVVEHYSKIEEALSRRVSEATLANVVWTEGNPDPIPAGWAGGTAQQVTDWQNEIDGAAETYHLIANLTGGAWPSYDGADAQMRTINNDPGISCPNANWNGVTTNYCSNVTADDVVAHEWGHAYTDFSHGLIYAWQPGALNESYSDLWGEIVDLVNGRGSDAPGGFRTDGSCSTLGAGGPATDNSYRWLLGEDASAFGGAIRDLWHPNCYGDPGKVSDVQYTCSSADSGGVHTNSGVPNHAFALIVDGGNYNGQAIAGIGLTKAAHIYWYAQTRFQTPTSGFEEHADALEASCGALIDAPLNALDTASVNPTVSGEVISDGDCDEVIAAFAAVELRTPPSQCGFEPMLQSPAPILCDGG
jgi:Zn-dependent metalloprotease